MCLSKQKRKEKKYMHANIVVTAPPLNIHVQWEAAAWRKERLVNTHFCSPTAEHRNVVHGLNALPLLCNLQKENLQFQSNFSSLLLFFFFFIHPPHSCISLSRFLPLPPPSTEKRAMRRLTQPAPAPPAAAFRFKFTWEHLWRKLYCTRKKTAAPSSNPGACFHAEKLAEFVPTGRNDRVLMRWTKMADTIILEWLFLSGYQYVSEAHNKTR